MVCIGIARKVTDFTTKSSKQQPDAVYAAAKPTTTQANAPVATTMPATGVAQTNDQRLAEIWKNLLKQSVKSLWLG